MYELSLFPCFLPFYLSCPPPPPPSHTASHLLSHGARGEAGGKQARSVTWAWLALGPRSPLPNSPPGIQATLWEKHTHIHGRSLPRLSHTCTAARGGGNREVSGGEQEMKGVQRRRKTGRDQEKGKSEDEMEYGTMIRTEKCISKKKRKKGVQ